MTLYAYAGKDKLVILEVTLKVRNVKQDSVHIAKGEKVSIVDDTNPKSSMEIESATDLIFKRGDMAMMYYEQPG